MAKRQIRIDATRKERWLTAYHDCGDQALMCFAFVASLIAFVCSIVFSMVFHPLVILGVITTLIVWGVNNKAEDAAGRVHVSGTNSINATDIYNRLNDIYRMPAEPIVKKVYDIERYAMRHCGGLSRGDERWQALVPRMDALRALEAKQKAEIVGPILDDETDLTAARMTLGS